MRNFFFLICSWWSMPMMMMVVVNGFVIPTPLRTITPSSDDASVVVNKGFGQSQVQVPLTGSVPLPLLSMATIATKLSSATSTSTAENVNDNDDTNEVPDTGGMAGLSDLASRLHLGSDFSGQSLDTSTGTTTTATTTDTNTDTNTMDMDMVVGQVEVEEVNESVSSSTTTKNTRVDVVAQSPPDRPSNVVGNGFFIPPDALLNEAYGVTEEDRANQWYEWYCEYFGKSGAGASTGSAAASDEYEMRRQLFVERLPAFLAYQMANSRRGLGLKTMKSNADWTNEEFQAARGSKSSQ